MQIKYFSWVKDQIGEESENITITEQIITVKDLINYLKKKNDKYAKAFNNSFIGMRGDRPTLLSLATQLNVMVIEPPKNIHQNHISHQHHITHLHQNHHHH